MNNIPQYSRHQTSPRANWGRFLSLVFVVVLLAWLWVAFAGSGQISSQNIHQPLSSAHRAQIELETGVAHLSLGTGAAGSLIEGRVQTFADEYLEHNYQQVGDQTIFQLLTKDSWSNILWFYNNKTPKWDLRLSPKLPLDLRLSTGVGDSLINLEGLNITNLNLSTGVGKTTLTLPSTGNFHAEVSSGVGQTIIRLPSGLAVRIWVSAGLGRVRVLGDFERRGEEYTSTNHQNAKHRVGLKISGGVGPITLETLP